MIIMTTMAIQSPEVVSQIMSALREDRKSLNSGKVPVAISRVIKSKRLKRTRKAVAKK